jgi:hypothetical protein
VALFQKIDELGRRIVAPLSSGDMPELLNYFVQNRTKESPHDTIPLHSWSANGDESDIDTTIQPKGNGAYSLDTNGNKRGRYSIDNQRVRATNEQVASGDYSCIEYGINNRASAELLRAYGNNAIADIFSMNAYSNGTFSDGRLTQKFEIIQKGISTKDNEIVLMFNGVNGYFPLQDNHVYSINIHVLAHRINGITEDDTADWWVKLLVYNIGTIKQSPVISNKVADFHINNSLNWVITVNGDGANLTIRCKGDTNNDKYIYWTAYIDGIMQSPSET